MTLSVAIESRVRRRRALRAAVRRAHLDRRRRGDPAARRRRARAALELRALALVPLGAASVTFAAGVNFRAPAGRGARDARLSDGAVREVFLGSTPIGAPLVGWPAAVGGRAQRVYAGAAAVLTAAAYAQRAFARAARPAARPGRPIAERARAWANAAAPARTTPALPPVHKWITGAGGRARPLRTTEMIAAGGRSRERYR